MMNPIRESMSSRAYVYIEGVIDVRYVGEWVAEPDYLKSVN